MLVHGDEGFYFGRGVFETIRVYRGRPLLWDKHMERLQTGCAALGMDAPDRTDLYHRVLDMALEDAAAKICVTPENILVTSRPRNYPAEQYAAGFRVGLSPVRKNPWSPSVRHKTLGGLDAWLAREDIRNSGFDEGLMLNTEGRVAEGCISNVFWIRDGIVFTPAESCGLLPGVQRAWVTARIPVTEVAVHIEEVYAADAVFLTNSLMGIMPVRQLDQVHYGVDHPVMTRLMALWEQDVEGQF